MSSKDDQPSGLHDRLEEAAGDRTYRQLGELTGIHPETVRRYMQGQSPSVDFVSRLCAGLGISGEWILTGRGPMRTSETRSHALREANPTELLTAMAGSIERVAERLDRVERFVQTLEVRLRSVRITPSDGQTIDAKPERPSRAPGGVDAESGTGGGGGDAIRARARRIAGAGPDRQRPPTD